MQAKPISDMVVYVRSDGTLTVDFLAVLKILIAMANDHESRITTLEP